MVFRDVTERKRAEQTQALMSAIVESCEDAIVSKTLDSTILSWNPGAVRLFGYTAEEAIGQPITLIMPPEKLDEEVAILDCLRRGVRIEHYETVRVAKDGRRLDISLTISPVRDSSGRIVGASKIARDVTERKRALQALAESEERQRKLADNLPSGYIYQVLHTPEDTRRFTYVSGGVESLCGLTPEEVIADPSRLYDLIVPEDQPRVQAAEEEAVRTGGPFDCQFRTRTRHGDIRWLHCRSAPRPYADGGMVWDGIAIDISEHRRIEEELAASRDQLEITFRGVADGITAQDPTGASSSPTTARRASSAIRRSKHFSRRRCRT